MQSKNLGRSTRIFAVFAALAASATDLGGRDLGPGETTEADRVALAVVERSARAYEATGTLAEDLDVVATAAAFLATEKAPPEGSNFKTTPIRSCSPDEHRLRFAAPR